MPTDRVILVTGVSGYWGSRLAVRLQSEPGYHVIGLDVVPPEGLRDLDFIPTDVRNPLLADLLATEGVDTVCHLAFLDTTRPSDQAFDVNVVGTTSLLEACVQAGVRKVVLKSSTAVYGARPTNPAFLREEHALRGSRRYGYTRDMIEIEAFCQGFSRREPQLMLTILRFCSIIGPTVDTPLARFLSEPLTPNLLGFDPLMQVIHEDDVVAALTHAVTHDAPGVFNVAAKDALPLSKIRGLAGKVPLPIFHPLAYWGVGLLGGTGLRLRRYVPLELDYIRYPWVGDLSRMEAELGFQPRYSAEQALREFATQHRLGYYLTDSARQALAEQRLRDIIEQRQRAKAQQTANAPAGEGDGSNE